MAKKIMLVEIDMSNQKITNVANPSNAKDVVTKQFMETALNDFLQKGGDINIEDYKFQANAYMETGYLKAGEVRFSNPGGNTQYQEGAIRKNGVIAVDFTKAGKINGIPNAPTGSSDYVLSVSGGIATWRSVMKKK